MPFTLKNMQKQQIGLVESLEYAFCAVSREEPIYVLDDIHVLGDAKINSLHTHNCLEFGYCLNGSGIFNIDNRLEFYNKGDVAIMNPGDYHRATSSPGVTSKWQWLWVDFENCIHGLGTFDANNPAQQLLQQIMPSGILRDTDSLRELLYLIVLEMNEKRPFYQTSVQAFMLNVSIELQRLASKENLKPKKERGWDTKIQPAIDCILAEYDRIIRIEELSSLCKMSLSSFRAKFQACTGSSPNQYINSVRLKMSEILLRQTDRSILDISISTGFQTLSSYNRFFKRSYNMSPSQFRRKHKG